MGDWIPWVASDACGRPKGRPMRDKTRPLATTCRQRWRHCRRRRKNSTAPGPLTRSRLSTPSSLKPEVAGGAASWLAEARAACALALALCALLGCTLRTRTCAAWCGTQGPAFSRTSRAPRACATARLRESMTGAENDHSAVANNACMLHSSASLEELWADAELVTHGVCLTFSLPGKLLNV